MEDFNEGLSRQLIPKTNPPTGVLNLAKRGRPKIKKSPSRDIEQAKNAGYSKLGRLFTAIQDLTEKSNKNILYPSIANQMIRKEERNAALSQMVTKGRLQLNLLSDSCALLYFCVGSSLERFKKEIRRQETTFLQPADLTLLPGAAEQANFSRNFNMTEDFALFRYKLQPMLLTCKTTTSPGSTKTCNLSARLLDSSPVEQGLGIAAKVEGVVQRLEEISAERAKENFSHKKGNWGALSLQTPARLLGAISWEFWESEDLKTAIEVLSGRKNQDLQRYDKITLARQEQRKKEDVLVQVRDLMSDVARENEIKYYSALLDVLEQANRGKPDPLEFGKKTYRQSKTVALLVPSFEGIAYACSQEALSFFRDSLRDELSTPLSMKRKSNEYNFYDGTLLSKFWKTQVDLSLLTATNAPISPGNALKFFRDAINTQRKRFDVRLKDTLLKYWNKILFSAPDAGPLKVLLERVLASSTGNTNSQPILFANVITGGYLTTPSEKSFPLRQQLERLGVLRCPDKTITSKLLLETGGASSFLLDESASHLIEMAKRLETFWVDEYGRVRSVGPVGKKERAPDGTWKRKFEKYINQVSTEIVRMILERFACAVQNGSIPIEPEEKPSSLPNEIDQDSVKSLDPEELQPPVPGRHWGPLTIRLEDIFIEDDKEAG